MLYCEKCNLLAEKTCPECGGPLREPKENDPVLLARTDTLHASMLEPLLTDEGIPYSKKGRMGVAFVLKGGSMLEEYSFYVPYGAYERAKTLTEVVCREEKEAEMPEIP